MRCRLAVPLVLAGLVAIPALAAAGPRPEPIDPEAPVDSYGGTETFDVSAIPTPVAVDKIRTTVSLFAAARLIFLDDTHLRVGVQGSVGVAGSEGIDPATLISGAFGIAWGWRPARDITVMLQSGIGGVVDRGRGAVDGVGSSVRGQHTLRADIGLGEVRDDVSGIVVVDVDATHDGEPAGISAPASSGFGYREFRLAAGAGPRFGVGSDTALAVPLEYLLRHTALDESDVFAYRGSVEHGVRTRLTMLPYAEWLASGEIDFLSAAWTRTSIECAGRCPSYEGVPVAEPAEGVARDPLAPTLPGRSGEIDRFVGGFGLRDLYVELLGEVVLGIHLEIGGVYLRDVDSGRDRVGVRAKGGVSMAMAQAHSYLGGGVEPVATADGRRFVDAVSFDVNMGGYYAPWWVGGEVDASGRFLSDPEIPSSSESSSLFEVSLLVALFSRPVEGLTVGPRFTLESGRRQQTGLADVVDPFALTDALGERSRWAVEGFVAWELDL